MDMKPVTHHCTCKDCGARFTVTGICGPVLTCDKCFKAKVAALWAMLAA